MAKIKEHWICRILGHKFVSWSDNPERLGWSYKKVLNHCFRCGLTKEEIKKL